MLGRAAAVVALIGSLSGCGDFRTGPQTQLGSALVITNDDYKMTVAASRITESVQLVPDPAPPAPGNHRVAVAFDFTNDKGSDFYEDAPSDAISLLDADGRTFRADPTSGLTSAGVALPAIIRLDPGASVQGVAVFTIPQTTRVASVRYGLTHGSGTAGVWKV